MSKFPRSTPARERATAKQVHNCLVHLKLPQVQALLLKGYTTCRVTSSVAGTVNIELYAPNDCCAELTNSPVHLSDLACSSTACGLAAKRHAVAVFLRELRKRAKLHEIVDPGGLAELLTTKTDGIQWSNYEAEHIATEAMRARLQRLGLKYSGKDKKKEERRSRQQEARSFRDPYDSDYLETISNSFQYSSAGIVVVQCQPRQQAVLLEKLNEYRRTKSGLHSTDTDIYGALLDSSASYGRILRTTLRGQPVFWPHRVAVITRLRTTELQVPRVVILSSTFKKAEDFLGGLNARKVRAPKLNKKDALVFSKCQQLTAVESKFRLAGIRLVVPNQHKYYF